MTFIIVIVAFHIGYFAGRVEGRSRREGKRERA
jgi:hypothetical protein